MNPKEMSAKDIRLLVRKSGLYLYQVADKIGISEPTITRWLRRLDSEKIERILKAIDKLVQENAVLN